MFIMSVGLNLVNRKEQGVLKRFDRRYQGSQCNRSVGQVTKTGTSFETQLSISYVDVQAIWRGTVIRRKIMLKLILEDIGLWVILLSVAFHDQFSDAVSFHII
jgi:hypothetical protein